MNIASKRWIKIFKSNVTSFNNFSVLGKVLTYKSAFSLDKLYPTSNLKIFTPTFVSL